ncbi:protein trichome birefringence-like 35 [Amborella trichopoda]|uniref:protein trichome birefringence-like 35 n=1 Tax=Amborella trichopoda TaxID=13333 RepID=UPI0009BE0394|nr:protein trichome birefringence-like 35 [Amborella trichopoda]|eukprot:XP_020529668.1 protein trichome birefringence-like 35 [Amborella trichopoda]
MSDQLAWRKYGRPDLAYRSWRWQPHHCNLTRWNATAMLEKLRGKRLMFVGDSLNRGQWISMVCLLQSVLSPTKNPEYNATVEFYWVPLLVESNSDDPVNHRLSSRIIRPDSIAKHGSYWKHADILVFNSYLWWRGELKIKLLSKGEPCEESEGLDAMNEALRTWADGVDSNVDARKTRVFFVTMSPIHLWSQDNAN